MRDKAIDLLTYHADRLIPLGENCIFRNEIAEIVDCIIAAAVEEMERKLEGRQR